MLTSEQVGFYRENGFLLVKGLLGKEEAEGYRRECHSLLERLSAIRDTDATWGSARIRPAGGNGAMMGGATNGMGGDGTIKDGMAMGQQTVLKHCHDVQFHSAAFSRLLVDERLCEALSQLMGSPNVQLHHNKMFVKPPEKGSPFPMHQDQPFFPHERHTMMAAIIHFDDAPLEKGCVRVVPGSHKLGPLEHEAEGGWHLPFDRYPLEDATACPAEAGDVLIFSYLTIHGSGVNTSNEARTTLLVQVRDPSDPPSNDEHRSRGQGTMLRGIDPLLDSQFVR